MPAPLSHLRPSTLREFLYGSPYYPEHWDADIRAGDPEMFRAAGWNVVRMGEFARQAQAAAGDLRGDEVYPVVSALAGKGKRGSY